VAHARKLRVVVGAFPGREGARYGAAVLAPEGTVLRGLGGVRAGADPAAAAMEATLQALWVARSFGRRARVCVWPGEVAGWLGRRVPVPDRYVGWFVQVRALSHAFREVEFLPATVEEAHLAGKVAWGSEPGAEGAGSPPVELVRV
jgi:hypothetical protein